MTTGNSFDCVMNVSRFQSAHDGIAFIGSLQPFMLMATGRKFNIDKSS